MAEWLSSRSEIPLCGKCGGLGMYIVYILKIISKGRYYISHKENLEKRLKEHNSGRTKSTKAYVPWQVVYKEEYNSKSEAFNREQEIKSLKVELSLIN